MIFNVKASDDEAEVILDPYTHYKRDRLSFLSNGMQFIRIGLQWGQRGHQKKGGCPWNIHDHKIHASIHLFSVS